MTDPSTSTYVFDEAVELTRRADGVLVRETMHPAWNVLDSFFNGGYVHALTTRAAMLVADGQPDPVAVSTVFIAPVRDEPAELHVDLLSTGRTVSTAQVRLMQGGRLRVQSVVTLGTLPDRLEAEVRHPMPDVPGPHELGDRGASKSSAWADVADLRFVPPYDGWIHGDISAGAQFMAWIRLRDDRPLDPLSVIAFSDMAPPVSFVLRRFGWAPTLQLGVGVFARPQGRWALMNAYGSPYGAAPFGCEDVDIWDETGTLVARARQVALPPRPPADDGKRIGH